MDFPQSRFFYNKTNNKKHSSIETLTSTQFRDSNNILICTKLLQKPDQPESEGHHQ